MSGNRLASSSNWRRMEEEKEKQRLEHEKAFDAGLIGPGGVIAPEAGFVVFVDHPEETLIVRDSSENKHPNQDIDLNISIEKNPRFGIDLREATYEGSPAS